MKNMERQLREYGRRCAADVPDGEVERAVGRARQAYLDGMEHGTAGFFAFLYQQARYIQKRWWALQMGVLAALGRLLAEGQDPAVGRGMGVAASLFAILIVPELWKNRTRASLEIEGAAYYSLRQVYAARMLLFAAADGILLSVSSGVFVHIFQVGMAELARQFFLPMTVTCGICIRTLCSRHCYSEYMAVFYALLWSAVWSLLVLREEIYQVISEPIWWAVCVAALLYLAYAVGRSLRDCKIIWEVREQWN